MPEPMTLISTPGRGRTLWGEATAGACFAGLNSQGIFSGRENTRYTAKLRELASRYGLDFHAQRSGYANWEDEADRIVAMHRRGELVQTKVVFIGHSNGGYAAIKAANACAAAGVNVHALIILDLTVKPEPAIVAGIANVIHIEGRGSLIAALNGKLKFAAGFHGQFERVEAAGAHVSMLDSPEVTPLIDAVIKRGGQPTEGSAMKPPFYIGEGRQISEQEIAEAAGQHGIPAYLALACTYKESANLNGSWSSGALVALYEDHVAWRNTSGEIRSRLAAEKLAAPGWRDLPYPASPYPAIDRCAEIAGEEVAALSTSWGLYQILGENHRLLDFPTAVEMVRAFAVSERAQFEGWVKIIKAFGVLDDLLAEDWAGYARRYNGPKYASHGYHTKLAALAERFKRNWGDGVHRAPAERPLPPPMLPEPEKPGNGSPGLPQPIELPDTGTITLETLRSLPRAELAQAARRATDFVKLALIVLEERPAMAAPSFSPEIPAIPPVNRKETPMNIGYISKLLGALIGGGGIVTLAQFFLPPELQTPEFIGALGVLFSGIGTYLAPKNSN